MEEKRVALVTGANQGVGFQVAKGLAAEGIVALVGSRNLARGETAAKEIGRGAVAIQLDVTDKASIAAAAKRIRGEFGRLDILVQNAAISNTSKNPSLSIEEYSKTTRPSNVSLDEVRTVWDTNVFGVLAVHQAMLPLLLEAPYANIVIVSSGVGSLALNADPAGPYRKNYGPVYSASKTALNAMALGMIIELEPTRAKVRIASPAFTKTKLNNFTGTESVEDGSREVLRVALLGPDAPNGTYTRWENQTIPW